jgi:hypothetical protein
VILITAFGSESLAREALSQDSPFRAYDYLVKPIDIDVLRDKVDRAAKRALGGREARILKSHLEKAFEFFGIIGTSEAVLKETKRIQKIARSKSTVLIVGETGTGKELFAQALHLNSPRAGKPFKVLNCAAVSETLDLDRVLNVTLDRVSDGLPVEGAAIQLVNPENGSLAVRAQRGAPLLHMDALVEKAMAERVPAVGEPGSGRVVVVLISTSPTAPLSKSTQTRARSSQSLAQTLPRSCAKTRTGLAGSIICQS